MSNAPHVKPLDRLRKGKRPVSKRVGIVMESRLQEDIDAARRKVADLERQVSLRGGVAKADPELADKLDEARDQLDTAQSFALNETEWFVAKALAPRAYDALMAQYPPTKDQKQQARKDGQVLQWNPDTFPPALLSACVYLVTPLDKEDENGETEQHEPLTEEFVKEMFDADVGQWNIGEVQALVQAAVEANHTGPQRVLDLGNG